MKKRFFPVQISQGYTAKKIQLKLQDQFLYAPKN